MPDQTENLEVHRERIRFETIKYSPSPPKSGVLLSASDPTLIEDKKLLNAGLNYIREYNKKRAE